MTRELRTKAGANLYHALIAMTGNFDYRTYFEQVKAIEDEAAVRPETDIDESLDTAWNEAEAALPEGWFLQLFDYGDPGPYNPGPDKPYHVPRYQASAELAILSSVPRHYGRSDDSPAAALRALTEELRGRATPLAERPE